MRATEDVAGALVAIRQDGAKEVLKTRRPCVAALNPEDVLGVAALALELDAVEVAPAHAIGTLRVAHDPGVAFLGNGTTDDAAIPDHAVGAAP